MLLANRFEVVESLGKGGMGVVYLAFDRERKVEVALKTLQKLSADAIYRFKREFRSLSELSHPNLVTYYEFFHDGTIWFFTMERVRGSNFLDWVRMRKEIADEPTRIRPASAEPSQGSGDLPSSQPGDATPCDEGRLRSAIIQLARGIHAIHAAGKTHRDVKPGNVMISEEQRVVLLDFGLAQDVGEHGSREDLQDRLSGTPAYMAPSRHRGQAASPASDWYSVGVMIYEALTGVRPYQSAAIFKGAEAPPASPAILQPHLPADLVKLAMDLLTWEDSSRPDGPAILSRLGDSGPAALPIATAPAQAFVGRERLLDDLRGAYATLKKGNPVLVQVHGRSGYGKTALIRHFLRDLELSRRTLVLSGRCYERESMPYKVFDSLLDMAGRHLAEMDPEAARELLPPDFEILGRLFPALLRVDTNTRKTDTRALRFLRSQSEKSPSPHTPDSPAKALDVDALDARERARRGSLALRELFKRLGEAQPLVLFVDDLQWGDLDSARLLADVLTPPNPPRLMLIFSFRTEDMNTNEVLRALLQAAAVKDAAMEVVALEVGPLSAAESMALVKSAADGQAVDRSPEVERLIQEAHGSPFFVQQVAHFLEAKPTNTVSLSDIVLARVGALPEQARLLLSTICVAGHPLPQAIALKASGLDVIEEAIHPLRTGSLVRVAGSRGSDAIEVFHDKIREAVVGSLASDRIQGTHLRLAEALEAEKLDDAETLLLHWSGAQRPDRAIDYALKAAAQASSALAFDRAVQLYKKAKEILPPGDARVQSTKTALAHALRNAGQGPEAAAAYLEAARTSAEGEALELKRLAFEQYLASGHDQEGIAVAKEVLAPFKLSLPSSDKGALASLLWQRMRVALRGLSFSARSEATVPAAELTRVDVCWSMATGLSLIDNKMGADFSSRYLRVALDSGEVKRIARGLALEAAFHGGFGNMAKANRMIESAKPLAEHSSDPHARGVVRLMTGFVEYFQGRYGAGLQLFDRARDTFRGHAAGATWEISTAHMMATWSLVYYGDWNELFARGPNLVAEATRRDNLYLLDGLTASYVVVQGLAQDRVAEVRQKMEEIARVWNPPGFQVQHYFRLLMGGWVDRYAGEGERAWGEVVRQWPALKASLLLKSEDVRFRLSLGRALAAIAAGPSRDLQRQAQKAASVIQKVKSAGARPLADLVTGLVKKQEGQVDAAASALRQAIEGLDKSELPLFAAGARWRLGEILGGDEGAQLVAAAKEAMTSRGVTKPEQMVLVFAPVGRR